VKHNLKITSILLAMFIITQLIGLYVVNFYSPIKVVKTDEGIITPVNVSAPELPYGMQTPAFQKEKDFYDIFPSIIFAFIIAIFLLFILINFKAEFILRFWFFAVVAITLGIAINAFSPQFKYVTLVVLLIAVPLAFIKIYRPNFYVHNLTELLIYPGIASVFVPILNLWTIIILLVLISIYDMWAVWHSGIMQKMAKYQINQLKIFSGFFVPYVSKKIKMKMQSMKKSKLKKVKVNVAILGGGDVVFPIIASGVVLKTFGLIPALFVVAGATIGLALLFFFAEKKKFYPAMPFISAGIFVGIIIGYLLM
jgi:presenilin-like A22 family membrane protease